MNTRNEANSAATDCLDPLTLPSGWVWVDFNDVAEIIPTTGKKIKEADYLPTGRLPIVDQGKDIVGGYTDHTDHRVECIPPVIVFGDHTRALKYINFDFAAGADGIKVIKPLPVFEPKLMYYFLQAVELPNRGYSRHFQFLRKTQLPLPPLPEQYRIVAEIETQFSRLEAGVAALKRVQAALRRYKASVLKAACEGRLVPTEAELARGDGREFESGAALLARILAERRAQWERANPGKRYVEPKGVEADGLAALPEGWVWASMDQFMADFRSGSTVVPQDAVTDYPILRSSSVRPMVVDLSDVRYLHESVSFNDDNFLEENDFLFTRLSGSLDYVGNCALIRGLMDRRIQYPDRIFRAKLFEQELSRFMEVYFASPPVRKQIMAKAKSTAGHQRISMTAIREQSVALPSLAEQHRIVAEVERRLSVAQEVEGVVAAGLRRAERLRQSILKQAFAGRLTSRARM